MIQYTPYKSSLCWKLCCWWDFQKWQDHKGFNLISGLHHNLMALMGGDGNRRWDLLKGSRSCEHDLEDNIWFLALSIWHFTLLPVSWLPWKKQISSTTPHYRMSPHHLSATVEATNPRTKVSATMDRIQTCRWLSCSCQASCHSDRKVSDNRFN